MTVTIDLPPETEAQVRKVAESEGVDVSTVFQEALRVYLPAVGSPRGMTDADLLQNINLGFPEPFWRRFRALAAKRDAGTLTPAEREELLSHSDRTEARDAERLIYLAELSRRRGVPVRALMDEMGLRPVRVS